MKQIITQGVTSKRLVVFIQDSSKTTGAGLTGVTAAASGFTWYYYREDSTAATVVTGTTETLGTWTSGGFVEISSAHMPGFYEIGVPNAVLAATNSPTWAYMQLSGVANMVPVNIELELSAFDLTTATQKTNVVQWLGTAVTSAAGVPIVNAGNTVAANVTQWLGTAVTSSAGVPVVSAGNTVTANVTQWLGTAVTSSAGIPIVDANLIGTPSVSVAQWLGTAVTSAAGVPNVNVIQFGGTAGTFAAGVPLANVNGTVTSTGNVNVVSWLGTAVTAATGGVPDVNVKNYNNHTAATDGNNLPKVDVEDFGGTAGTFTSGVPNANATLSGTMSANVVQWLGHAVAAANNGYPDVNTKYYNGLTAQTDANQLPSVNAVDWIGSAIPGVNVTGIPLVDISSFDGTAVTLDGGLLETVVATNLDKTGYVLSAGQITVKKNTALAGFTFAMFSSTAPNGLATGLSVTSSRSIDGGSVAGTTNSVTEVGSGIYKLNLAAGDLNGNSITFIFTASGALDTAFTFVTQP